MSAPLQDRLVIVTRAREDAAPLVEALEEREAKVLCVPSISFVAAPPEPEAISDLRAESVSHVVFTSARAAKYFTEWVESDSRIGRSAWETSRFAAIGAATSTALTQAGWEVDFVANARDAQELAEELLAREGLAPHHRVLLPCSNIGRRDLLARLRAAGVTVVPLVLYETRPGSEEAAAPLLRSLEEGIIPHAVTFMSPSAFRGFLAISGPRVRALLKERTTAIVTIGATTSEAVREDGFIVDEEADVPSAAALVEAVSRVSAPQVES